MRGPSGGRAPLLPEVHRRIGVGPLPVYSCGNDQSCAAAGAGLAESGDYLCGFGTAMVVYGVSRAFVAPADESQIAGLSCIEDLWFLLGVESNFGNVLQWLARMLAPTRDLGLFIDGAMAVRTGRIPAVVISPDGRLDIRGLCADSTREHILRALLEQVATRFEALLAGVSQALGPPRRLVCSGGWTRSSGWIDLLRSRCSVRLEVCPAEQPGLLGAARVIRSAISRVQA